MTVFAVIAPEASEALAEAVTQAFAGRFYRIGPGQFLVASETMTTPDVNDALGAARGEVGRVLVLPVTNYTGWHDRDMWEWIGIHTQPAGIALGMGRTTMESTGGIAG
jgi:hypothetical protein